MAGRRAPKVIPHTLVAEPATPATPRPRVRASKSGARRALVLLLVHVLIGLHITHWLVAGETMTPVEPSEAIAFSRSSVVNAGLIFFAAMILLTAIFGRFFCGWGCHLVALQDLCRHWLMKIGITPQPLRSRWLAWVPTLAFVYMFLWPAAWRLWTGESLAVTHVELTTSQFWATFPGWAVGIATLLVCGFACVYFLGAKGFCTYACPYGAIFAAADRLAPLRIRVSDACHQCGHCTAVCSSNVRVHEEVRDHGMVVSPGCMKCLDCVSVCPNGALSYSAGPIPLFARPRVAQAEKPRARLRLGEEALLALVFATSFLAFRGLYGLVPFLMALGVAGICAFLAWTLLRLLREPTVIRPGLRLKRGGRLLPTGRALVLACVLLAALAAHSLLVQGHDWLASRAYERLLPQRHALLAAPGAPGALGEDARAAADTALRHARAVEAIGLLATPGNAARLAWLQALAGDQEAAGASSQLAIDRGEWIAEMRRLRAHLALLRGDPAAAVSEWQFAIAAAPQQADAYLALGLFQAQAGDIDAARLSFESGLATNPDSLDLRYNAGLAHALAGDGERAIAALEAALRIDPAHRPSRENLAGVLAALGRFGEAVRHFRIALDQAPDDARTHALLVRALLAAGERASAAEELGRALARHAADPELLALRTEVAGGE